MIASTNASLRRSSRIITASTSNKLGSTATVASTNVIQARRTAQTAATSASSSTSPGTANPRKRTKVEARTTVSAEEVAEEDSEPAASSVQPKARKAKGKGKAKAAVEYRPEDFPSREVSAWKVGPHVSAAGGVENTVLNAASIGATAFALFVKSQRKWTSSELTPDSIASFQRRLKDFGYNAKHVLPHGSYLVNLGNPDEEKRAKSYECFLDDLK